MIPTADILAWRTAHPWASNAQVEQDLLISRAIIELFSRSVLREQVAFRGGTALHKLFLQPAARYSEDIDLVQMRQGPIGPVMDGIHAALDSWLGTPKREQKTGGVKLTYRVESEIPPVSPMRLKVEINTREHFTLLGPEEHPLSVESRWFSGNVAVPTFALNELLGTKLRALYQRRKGRDLFDLWLGLTQGGANGAKVAEIFRAYLAADGKTVSRKEFEMNLELKLGHPWFQNDLPALLRPGLSYDVMAAYRLIMGECVARL